MNATAGRPRSVPVIIGAFLFTVTVLGLGFAAFGFWTSMIFASGFLGGFLLWLAFPAEPAYRSWRAPFLVTFALFIAHRVEEKQSGFFAALATITKVPTPEITSWKVIALVVASVGAWLAIPILTKRGSSFGYYLAWTFFAAMGITELAHFIFPLLADGSYGYFPGMASVLALAPVAWWGMLRLAGRAQPSH